jgi:ABC-type branched-subunit amino acid transport system ATPase component
VSLLELTDVSLAFDGVRAVQHVSASVEAGQIVALIGPNGAGKTTLLNLLCGTLAPDAGSIRFREREVTGWPPHRLAGLGMARTFQNLALFGAMSVGDTLLVGRHRHLRTGLIASALRLPRHAAEERRHWLVVRELLIRLDLAEWADRPATALPYGLQRRVELGRALAAEPALLLLDEPMAGLADEEVREVGELIRELAAQGLTVLLVEHHMEAVMALSDRVLLLVQGSLLLSGTPDEVRTNPAAIAAYLGEEIG